MKDYLIASTKPYKRNRGSKLCVLSNGRNGCNAFEACVCSGALDILGCKPAQTA